MKHLAFLVPPDVQLGFSLAGIRAQHCSPAELVQAVRELMQEEQVGIIAVEERLLDHNSSEALPLLEKTWPGLLIVLPAPGTGEVAREDYAMQLINKAIGYHVRLGG